jgi:hypothetical protein
MYVWNKLLTVKSTTTVDRLDDRIKTPMSNLDKKKKNKKKNYSFVI